MKNYQKELKKNRDFKATEIINNSFEKSDIDIKVLNRNLLRDISLIQNRARGPMFELMAEVIIRNAFGIKNFNKQNVYSTPYGKRRIDLFLPETGVAIEVKSGYARSKKFIREQIKKDNYILNNEPLVKQIVWMCFRGATKPLIVFLKKNNIEYCDIGYDKFDSKHETKESDVIRI